MDRTEYQYPAICPCAPLDFWMYESCQQPPISVGSEGIFS